MMRLYHLPFLMTSFMPWSSAAAIPNPITKMKMNLKSLHRSVNTPKNQRFPSGNQDLSNNSASPIQMLGTEEREFFIDWGINMNNILNITEEEFDWMSKPEFHSLYERHIVRSQISEEVKTGQGLDDFTEGSFETEIVLVLRKRISSFWYTPILFGILT